MGDVKNVRNQGMSLVELLVSVAVLGIAMIGILALINLSTKYYANSNKEVEVQSELQTTFTMVSNMLVDANSGISFTTSGSDKIAEITNQKTKYVVRLVGKRLYVKEFTPISSAVLNIQNDDANLLADHVESFVIDTTHYDDGYVTMGMSVKYGSREATMTKNVFLRNSTVDVGTVYANCTVTSEKVEVSGKNRVKFTITNKTGADISGNITLQFKLNGYKSDTVGTITAVTGLNTIGGTTGSYSFNRVTGALTVHCSTSSTWANNGNIVITVGLNASSLETSQIVLSSVSK